MEESNIEATEDGLYEKFSGRKIVSPLDSLVEKWEATARRKFLSADHQKDDPARRPTGKKFIEHGAICYCNCARELKEALSSLSPSSLAIQGECQK